jgi:osmotically-inducible protein OsmY
VDSIASSAEIATRIEDALSRIDKSGNSRVLAFVHGRTLTLMGSLHSFAARDEAERVALSVPGISKVENQIIMMP